MAKKHTVSHTEQSSGLSGRRVEGKERGPSAQEQFEQQTEKISANLKATIHQYRKWLRLAAEAGAGEGQQERTIQQWLEEMDRGGRRGDVDTKQILRERSIAIDGERPPYQEIPTHSIAEGTFHDDD